MLGTRTLRAVVVITLVVMAVPVGAERGPFAQLPEEWRQLFPAETEVLDLGLLPVIQEAPGNTPTPFALPGTAHVIMVPEVYYEGTTGALEGGRGHLPPGGAFHVDGHRPRGAVVGRGG